MSDIKDAAFNISMPHWLFASGDRGRLEVLRSPCFLNSDDPSLPAFIADNGLVLAAREEFDSEHFMFGEVGASVYMTPASRMDAYATRVVFALKADGFAGSTPGVLGATARGHVHNHWPFPDADDDDQELHIN